jgi:hypothetical protein
MNTENDIRSPPAPAPFARRPNQPVDVPPGPRNDVVRVLVVVEGTNDIEFLKRASAILRAHDGTLPDLATMQERGQLIFLPFGGGGVASWAQRLAPLELPEFHLYDHELPPETELRREAAAQVNRRQRCCATLTGKRSVENYLHPQAISAALDIDVEFDDFDPLAELTAKRSYLREGSGTPWELLRRRARKRLTHRAKRLLNTCAINRMTAELFAASDPDGEVRAWLATINDLANGQP